MVDEQETIAGVVRAERQGQVDEEIAVVAELPRLTFGGLLGRVEFRHVGGELVTPACEHLGFEARRHVMGFVVDPLQLRELERGCRSLRVGLVLEQQADETRRDGKSGNSGGAPKNVAARQAFVEDVVEGPAAGC